MIKTTSLLFVMYVATTYGTDFGNAIDATINTTTELAHTLDRIVPPKTYLRTGDASTTELDVAQENGLTGIDLLNGIRNIIAADPNVPRQEIPYKPFVGSFSTIKDENDPSLATTSYCMTDNACGHMEAYSQQVPLTELSCNMFCYISKEGKYVKSNIYSVETNPPKSYLNCGWEQC